MPLSVAPPVATQMQKPSWQNRADVPPPHAVPGYDPLSTIVVLYFVRGPFGHGVVLLSCLGSTDHQHIDRPVLRHVPAAQMQGIKNALKGVQYSNPALGERLYELCRKATSRHIDRPDEILNQQVCSSIPSRVQMHVGHY